VGGLVVVCGGEGGRVVGYHCDCAQRFFGVDDEAIVSDVLRMEYLS